MLPAARNWERIALKWRNIGPNRGGRSIAVAGSTSRPLEYYFGATGGGLWKTTDGGTTWTQPRKVAGTVSVDGPTGTSTLSMRDMALLSACGDQKQTRAREGLGPSRALLRRLARYGRLTLVESPAAEMLNVPDAVEAV
jgi:hypothetical protein